MVPIPTRPLFSMANNELVAEAVDEETSNSTLFVSPAFACTDNLAYGDVVPTPTEVLFTERLVELATVISKAVRAVEYVKW